MAVAQKLGPPIQSGAAEVSRLMMRRSNDVLAAVSDWVPKVRLTGKASEPSHAISGISKTEESLWMPHCSLQRCERQASAYDGFEMKCVPAVEREGQVKKAANKRRAGRGGRPVISMGHMDSDRLGTGMG